ncbi:hypothetical protein OG21DRAFT_1513328 [Imleria badia]|nr:hypothetical protein OG21DRAFT_1513328 [Imleria badia]
MLSSFYRFHGLAFKLLNEQPPTHRHAPPNSAGRFSAGICDNNVSLTSTLLTISILGFERLPASGGFFGIAMELFDRAYPFSEASGSKIEEWKKELEELVQSFHDLGYVHGDLRSPNIFCDGEKVKLLDFDWGGKQGDVYYPEGPLNPDLERGREMSNLEITKDDDIRVLRQTSDSVV